MKLLKRLHARLFVCAKVGHSPSSPARGSHGYLSEYCARCGDYLYGKWNQ